EPELQPREELRIDRERLLGCLAAHDDEPPAARQEPQALGRRATSGLDDRPQRRGFLSASLDAAAKAEPRRTERVRLVDVALRLQGLAVRAATVEEGADLDPLFLR